MKEKGPILAFIRRIVGYDDEFARNLAAIGQRISCLSLEQAQRHVRHLLDDESRYKVVRSAPGAAAAELLRRLPPSVRDFYVEFERVEERQGEVRLIRDEIGEAEHAPGFIRVGTNSDFREMVVSGADDQMHVVDGSEKDVLTEAEPSPSLMHYFLVEAWVIHPEVVEALLDEKRWE